MYRSTSERLLDPARLHLRRKLYSHVPFNWTVGSIQSFFISPLLSFSINPAPHRPAPHHTDPRRTAPTRAAPHRLAPRAVSHQPDPRCTGGLQPPPKHHRSLFSPIRLCSLSGLPPPSPFVLPPPPLFQAQVQQNYINKLFLACVDILPQELLKEVHSICQDECVSKVTEASRDVMYKGFDGFMVVKGVYWVNYPICCKRFIKR
ncbi:hypothetical protein RIF29_24976 [Crotalaria pallida]|uniref:Uncharacterized protein n=1 Tax=Crotalaria pallida TaxID=3830 RepID=A0AAN9ELK2_CROPI